MWERIRLRRLEHKRLRHFSMWKNLSLTMCIMPIIVASLVLSSLDMCLSVRIKNELERSNDIDFSFPFASENILAEGITLSLTCLLVVALVIMFIIYCRIIKEKNGNHEKRSSGEEDPSRKQRGRRLEIAMLIVSVTAFIIMLLHLYTLLYMILGLHVLVVIMLALFCFILALFLPFWFLRNEGVEKEDINLLREATFKPLTPLSILVSILLATLPCALR